MNNIDILGFIDNLEEKQRRTKYLGILSLLIIFRKFSTAQSQMVTLKVHSMRIARKVELLLGSIKLDIIIVRMNII